MLAPRSGRSAGRSCRRKTTKCHVYHVWMILEQMSINTVYFNVYCLYDYYMIFEKTHTFNYMYINILEVQ